MIKLDVLRSTVYDLRAGVCYVLYFWCSHYGCIINYGCDQYHRDHFEYARAWNDSDEDATFCVDVANYSIPFDCSYASPCGCCDNDVDGHSFWHVIL